MNLLGKMAGTSGLGKISGAPQINPSFSGWTSPLILLKIVQQIVNGFVQDITTKTAFNGIVQPLSPKTIALKPEGERAWAWLQIHIAVACPIKLDVQDKILYNDRRYKVMARLDYSANGYIELHAVEDFQNANPR